MKTFLVDINCPLCVWISENSLRITVKLNLLEFPFNLNVETNLTVTK